jgi:hypothetical protein
VLEVPALATVWNLDERAEAQLALLDLDALFFTFLVLATGAIVGADFCFFFFCQVKVWSKRRKEYVCFRRWIWKGENTSHLNNRRIGAGPFEDER